MFNVSAFDNTRDFDIIGVSYAGNPRHQTAIFITKKVESLLTNLDGDNQCLVFLENGIEVPNNLKKNNVFVFSDNPQRDYAEFTIALDKAVKLKNKDRTIKFSEEGYFIGENVSIGLDSYIGPGCYIGHDVVIGKNAYIMPGAVIQHTVAGDNLVVRENGVLGGDAFNHFEDETGAKMDIPSFGKVIVGNNVDIGGCTVVERGAAGDTVLDDNVKLDNLVVIGHDSHIYQNVEIAACTIIGGFVDIKENTFVGLNVTVKNRINIGANSILGMSAAVLKDVSDSVVMVGNPAKPLVKEEK